MLAGLGTGDGHIAVEMIGGRDRDGVHVRMNQHVAQVGRPCPRVVFDGDGLGAFGVHIAHRDEIGGRMPAVGLGVALAEQTGANQCEAVGHISEERGNRIERFTGRPGDQAQRLPSVVAVIHRGR